MGKKRLIRVVILIGCGLFFLALGLHVCWIDYNRSRFFSYGFKGTDVFATQVFTGVFIVSGFVITILGGLVAFKAKIFWWKIASVLLLVSLLLPWWQWSYRWVSAIPEDGGGMFSAHSFLFGFLATSFFSRGFRLRDLSFIQNIWFISDISFVPYLTLGSASQSWPFVSVLVREPWLNVSLVRALCYVVLWLLFSTSVLGWSSKKKLRLIGAFIGWASIIFFMIWLYLAWSGFGLGERWFIGSVNPYFGFVPNRGYSFLSFGFFAAMMGIIILTVSLFMKDMQKISNVN
jgi:hypothetical protein